MLTLAHAQDAATAATGGLPAIIGSALPFILVFAVFYFLLLRPQMQTAKKHAAMISALKKGDVVVTDGGLIGEIAALKDAVVHVRAAEGVVLAVAREAVRNVLTGDAAKGWEAAAKPAIAKKR